MTRDQRHVPSLTRRELLRVGGVSLVGGFLRQTFTPVNVHAQRKVTPMATARQVLFINIEGGMSQIDTLDAREGPWTPADFDIRSAGNGLKLPYGLMRTCRACSTRSPSCARSAAWDAVHGRAQYYIQTGHPLNLALAKEVPAIGAVVAHELAPSAQALGFAAAVYRDELCRQSGRSDQPGVPLGRVRPHEPARSGDGPPDLVPRDGVDPRPWRGGGSGCSSSIARYRGGRPAADRSFIDYHEYYRSAWAIMNDPRVSADLHDQRRGQDAVRQQRDRQLARARAQPVPGRRGHAVHPGQPRRLGSSRRHLQGEVAQPPGADQRAGRALGTLISDLDSTPSRQESGADAARRDAGRRHERVRPHTGPDQRHPAGPRALHPRTLRHVRRRRDQTRRGDRQDRRGWRRRRRCRLGGGTADLHGRHRLHDLLRAGDRLDQDACRTRPRAARSTTSSPRRARSTSASSRCRSSSRKRRSGSHHREIGRSGH